ncbi:MAG: type II toxin-antitoxin system VapC family toxin [Jatrophihabitans sp.]
MPARSGKPEMGFLAGTARKAITEADDLVVSAITWFESAWLATRGRIAVSVSVATWLRKLSSRVATIPITAELAGVALALPSAIPSDPADRLLYATAIHHELRLVTKDSPAQARRSAHGLVGQYKAADIYRSSRTSRRREATIRPPAAMTAK